MTHFNQNKHINTLIVSVLRSQQVQVELQNSVSITYGILDNIFQILDAENVPVKQIIPCLAILSKKVKMISEKKLSEKNIQMTLRNNIQISQRKGKKKGLLGMWVFSAKI